MASLFDKAKKSAPAKTTKAADSKPRINVDDINFFEKIEKIEKLNDTMKSAKAQADMLSDEIREVCKEKWADLYQEKGKNPGSVMVESKLGKDVSQVMFIPQDKYITIDEEKANSLREDYGDSVVEETTTFSFDSEMIDKYGEILSRMIEESTEISDVDKEKIIKATTKFSVAKGTIDELNKLGKVNEVMDVIRPVVMLKGPEVIRG